MSCQVIIPSAPGNFTPFPGNRQIQAGTKPSYISNQKNFLQKGSPNCYFELFQVHCGADLRPPILSTYPQNAVESPSNRIFVPYYLGQMPRTKHCLHEEYQRIHRTSRVMPVFYNGLYPQTLQTDQ